MIIIFFTAVYCNETVPELPENSVTAVHDVILRQQIDPHWNSFQRWVCFRCRKMDNNMIFIFFIIMLLFVYNYHNIHTSIVL